MRKTTVETKNKILSVCVRLFLEQGYKETSVSQIVQEAQVARGSYQNIFPTKDAILAELVEVMFEGQFMIARSSVDASSLSPLYVYAIETTIQLTLTEHNENLREIYLEAYSSPKTSDYIYQRTAVELKKIFSSYLPWLSESDFYEMEIGSAGIMRNYMAKKCDIHFSLNKKIERFLELSLRAYCVPEEEIQKVAFFVKRLDIETLANEVMKKLFSMLEGKFDFKLQVS